MVKDKIPTEDFLSKLSAPSRWALEKNQITTLKKLSTHTEKEILKLHGVGKSTIPKLIESLQSMGLTFKTPQ